MWKMIVVVRIQLATKYGLNFEITYFYHTLAKNEKNDIIMPKKGKFENEYIS